MNNQRRKAIAAVLATLEDIAMQLEAAAQAVRDIADEETEYLENMPEAFRDGDKGERVQEGIDALESAVDDLEAFDFDDIRSVLEGL